jgi:hypothetical protein
MVSLLRIPLLTGALQFDKLAQRLRDFVSDAQKATKFDEDSVEFKSPMATVYLRYSPLSTATPASYYTAIQSLEIICSPTFLKEISKKGIAVAEQLLNLNGHIDFVDPVKLMELLAPAQRHHYSEVPSSKPRDRHLSEAERKDIAELILFDDAKEILARIPDMQEGSAERFVFVDIDDTLPLQKAPRATDLARPPGTCCS